MPMYEYRCPSCGEVFEELRRLSQADEPAECPRCKERAAARVMSATSALSSAGGGGVSAGGGGCQARGGFT